MAIFFENQALTNNAYEMPDDLKKHLASTFIANSQYSQSDGYKKALHLCDPDYNNRSKGKKTQGKNGIPYGSLKKLKMTFNNINPKSLEYNLLGGEKMKHWVNDTLNRERSKVEPELARKKSEKLKNNTRPAKLTTKPLKSGNVQINLKESRGDNPYLSYLEDYDAYSILQMFEMQERPWVNLINPSMYKQALTEFTKFGKLIHFPTDKIYQWMGIIMRNTATLRTITDFAGHSEYLPLEGFLDQYFYDIDSGELDYEAWSKYKEDTGHEEDEDYGAMIDFLDEKHFFEWFQLPDGSDPWSDFGIVPLEKIIYEYSESMSPEQVLVLVNKALDVVHCRGDLSSIFIQGGSKVLSQISEDIIHDNKKVIHLTEQQLIKLKKLLK